MKVLYLSISLGNLSLNQGIYTNLAVEFKNQGHNVYAIAPQRGDDRRDTFLAEENGISIIRVNTNAFSGVSMIKKGLAYQKMIFQFYHNIRKYFWDIHFDLIISTSLPLELPYVVHLIKGHFKCPFYLLQYDYLWQSAVNLGLYSRNSLPCLYYRNLERIAYKTADYIGVPTKGNIDFITKFYPKFQSRIRLLPMFLNPIKFTESEYSFRKEEGLEDKFLVVYGGSVGLAQKIDYLLTLASSCIDIKDICFLIIGKGQFWEKIKKEVTERGLTNIRFVSFMPQDKYLKLLSECDVGMVILNEKLASPNFPSKTVSYFNLGIPILASIDYVTDYGRFLEETNTGLWSYSGDNDKLKSNLVELYSSSERREEMHNNSLQFYASYMKPEHAYSRIMEQIQK